MMSEKAKRPPNETTLQRHCECCEQNNFLILNATVDHAMIKSASPPPMDVYSPPNGNYCLRRLRILLV